MSEDQNSRLQRWGIAATKIYIILIIGGIPAAAALNFLRLEVMKLNELGDFLAGAFGPLAIFWLILGFFQQGHELQNSVDALRLQAEELKQSVEQQKAMVQAAERQLELDVAIREDQVRLLVSKELPFALPRAGGWSSSGKGHSYEFYLKNAGASAMAFVISASGEGEGEFFRQEYQFLDAGREMQFSLNMQADKKLTPSKTYLFRFVLGNIRGQQRIQEFEYKDSKLKMVTCIPEQA